MKNSGYFGEFGGRFVPETLIPPLAELQKAYEEYGMSNAFREEFHSLLKDYSGRPTPLYYSGKLSAHCGCSIYLKREDLNHTGAHKINNAIGQALLARKMKKKRNVEREGSWHRLRGGRVRQHCKHQESI